MAGSPKKRRRRQIAAAKGDAEKVAKRHLRPKRKKIWKAPRSMPKDLAALVAAGEACGYYLGKRGTFCWKPSLEPASGVPVPHRCEEHSTPEARRRAGGAPKGNKNGKKHGFYECALIDDEERELWQSLRWDDMTPEIEIERVRLRRAIVADAAQERRLASMDAEERAKALELREYRIKVDEDAPETPDPGEAPIHDGTELKGKSTETHKVYRIVDYKRRVATIAKELAVFVKLQSELQGGPGGGKGAEEVAAKVREFMAEAKGAFGEE